MAGPDHRRMHSGGCAIGQAGAISHATLKQCLVNCGYVDSLLAPGYRFDKRTLPFVGFAHKPWDARSACIAILDSADQLNPQPEQIRGLGAPVVFSNQAGGLTCWKQTADDLVLIEHITSYRVERYFKEHREVLSPASIYNAKTRGRLMGSQQLSFVDVGLMPAVEETMGQDLAGLVSRAVGVLETELQNIGISRPNLKDVFKSVFWLLTAKILHDKNVPGFKNLSLDDVRDSFHKVGRHYSDDDLGAPGGMPWLPAIEAAAGEMLRFSHLGNITPESLASVYESSLVPRDLRKALGIHSTPSYLVDYILGKLYPWIKEVPETDRYVFEPACGSAAFLVGSMRLLRELSPEMTGEARHRYLKEHLFGIELYPFALEVARLSLTLADIPHSNGWRLKQGDIFGKGELEKASEKARIILANPPFERFTSEEREQYSRTGTPVRAATKAIEMLNRIIPNLGEGSVLGLVMPVGVLHSNEGRVVRERLLRDFAIHDICLLPKNAFQYSHHETGLIICRKSAESKASNTEIAYNRITAAGMEAFRKTYATPNTESVSQTALIHSPDYGLQWRELESVWKYCDSYPRFGDLAKVGEGFSFVRRDQRPENSILLRNTPPDGYVATYLGGIADTPIYGQPKENFCRLGSDVVQVPRSGVAIGEPQILLNHAHLGIPWMVRAILDYKGHPVSNNFMTARPISTGSPLEYLWAILNYPFANAFAVTNRTSRHVLAGMIEKLPVPAALDYEIANVVESAREYLRLVREANEPPLSGNLAVVKNSLLRMDAAVLRLYDLPPRLERHILNMFAGRKRPGVGCAFDGYFPPDFSAWVPLHEYISEEYQAATSREAILRYVPIKSQATLDAIKLAYEAIGAD